MKVAIITSGEPSNTKGIMNYVREKMSRMQQLQNDEFSVDLYMIRRRYSIGYSIIFRLFKGWNGNSYRNDHSESFQKGEVLFHNLWVDVGLLDFFINTKLSYKPISTRSIRRLHKYLQHYDIVATHKLDSHYLGYTLWKEYGIPYVATWHGSDIHTDPILNPKLMHLTKAIIENAGMNFFVSKALKEESYRITPNGLKEHIYTGPSSSFIRFEDGDRKGLRKRFGVVGKKVVAYVGNIIDVKNVMCLPGIFKKVADKFQGEVKFWIIGNGNQEQELITKLKETTVNYKHWGKIQPEEMPEYMNCIDVLVFPSKKEGIGLVALEARSCGANVVGSKVGGIPEGIGQTENCFLIDEDFYDNISERIVEILDKGEKPKPLSQEFSWGYAVQKEFNIYMKLAEKRK